MTLYVDGTAVANGRVERTHPLYFSFDEGLGVGVDTGMPVHEDYKHPGGRFNGTISWAQIDFGLDDHNHLIDPEEHLEAVLTHR